MTAIKDGVLVTQFFNTGLLTLLSTTNQIESSIPFLRSIFRGPYTDFNSQWFRQVGPIIVDAMLIASFMPLIEFAIAWATG